MYKNYMNNREILYGYLRKLWLIMRLTTVILIATLMQVSAAGFAQKLSYQHSNASLEDIFREIRKQTGYNVLASTENIQKAKPVNVNFKNTPLETVLDFCLKNQNLSYTIDKKTILIKEAEPSLLDRLSNVVKKLVNDITVKGKVVDQDGKPLPNASIRVKGKSAVTNTNQNGEFEIKGVDEDAVLLVSYVGFKTLKISLKDAVIPLEIKLSTISGELKEVNISTGYQTLKPNETTGSFSVIDNKQINRSVTTNILDRIENLVPGVLVNRGDAAKTDPLLIRGRSTIYGSGRGNEVSAAPLIVLDNFPYDGDMKNINPNDIETITFLKDASTASIWGARAANGVIVMTSKQGKTAKTSVQLNSSLNLQARPDFSTINMASSADFIELEKLMFANGAYSGLEASAVQNKTALTPVLELLIAKRDNPPQAAQIDAQIENLKQYDIKKDWNKYLYRNSANQQHSLNVSGNTPNINYYMSAGYDRNLSNLVGESLNRLTLSTRNTFNVTEKFQIDAGINYLQSNDKKGSNLGYNNSGGGSMSYYPYTRLTDDNGNPLPFNKYYRGSFAQSAQQAGLLNWEYSPITDIDKVENKIKIRDFVINTAAKYKIFDFLNAEVKYQYEDQLSSNSVLNGPESFFARDMVNRYTQKSSAGVLTYPVPKGGILNLQNGEIESHQVRGQLNYNQTIAERHQLSAIAGYEIRSYVTTSNRAVTYGYDPDNLSTSDAMDFVTRFPQYTNPFLTNTIPNAKTFSKFTDHFLSYYANASYTFKKRYIISGSARKDEANLFGVKTNQKGAPFYSVGGAWILTNEDFIKASSVQFLKLRASYGVNGNISRQTSASTTVAYFVSNTTLPFAVVRNPPNENLKWESVKVLNLGVDFAIKNNIISGSIDYYQKRAVDLMAQAPVDPTLGIGSVDAPSFFGNVANMKGSGVDLQINSRNLNGTLKWQTSLIYSRTIAKLSKYLMPVSTSGSIYITPGITPIIGRPLYSLYSYRWAGLDPANGMPRGYVDGEVSNNYSQINTTKLDDLVYNGSVQPTDYGALLNTFSYKNFSISFNISYKFGFYFRNSFLGYTSTGSGSLDKTYKDRWKQAGDENKTNVLALIFPIPTQNEAQNFYANSEVLVSKGDHIRLEDINLSYEMNKNSFKRLPFSNVRFYLYMSNLGVLWKANDKGIDPYFNGVATDAKRIALGLSVGF